MKLEDLLSLEFINEIKNEFILGNESIHGYSHWQRVFKNGFLLSNHYRIDPKIVAYFSVLHDCKRENEFYDTIHGRYASKYAECIRDKIDLNDNLFDKLVYAIEFHSDGTTSNGIEIGICFDADRLDLGRVGVKPSAQFMSTEHASLLCE